MLMFTNSEIHEFIDLYKGEPILWDHKHPQRRNKNEVTDAWIRIQKAMSLKCSVSDLKRKKESLMTTFRLNAQRRKTLRDFKPSWFAYDQMASFLGEKYDRQSIKDEDEFDSSSLQAYFEEINNTSGINLEAIENCQKKVDSRKRKRIKTDSDDCFQATELIISDDSDIKEPSDEMTYEKDECDIYCQLLAMKLRKLNEYERDLAMHEIDNIMFQAKMKKSQDTNLKKKRKSRHGKDPVFVGISQQTPTDFKDVKYEDTPQSSE